MFRAIVVFVLMTSLVTALYTPVTHAAQVDATQREVLLQQIRTLTKLIQQLQAQLEEQRAKEAREKLGENTSDSSVMSVTEDDHVRGNLEAETQLIVYTDYDCPFCNKFHDTLSELLPETFDETEVVWAQRHFPIAELHQGAETVAIASECVAKYKGNDAFWKFTDEYFSYKSNEPYGTAGNSRDVVDDVLDELGFGTRSIEKCIDQENTKAEVQEDLISGETAGVRGTPMSYLISKHGTVTEIAGAQPISTVAQIIQQVLESDE